MEQPARSLRNPLLPKCSRANTGVFVAERPVDQGNTFYWEKFCHVPCRLSSNSWVSVIYLTLDQITNGPVASIPPHGFDCRAQYRWAVHVPQERVKQIVSVGGGSRDPSSIRLITLGNRARSA